MEKPIAYEPHPVSPERKAELIAGGYKIMDIAYKPAGSAAAHIEKVAKAIEEAPKTEEVAADEEVGEYKPVPLRAPAKQTTKKAK